MLTWLIQCVTKFRNGAWGRNEKNKGFREFGRTKFQRYRKIAYLCHLIAVLASSPVYAQTLDRFGGRKDIPCTANAKKWHTEKIGDRWWICTPESHGLFLQDVEYINLTDGTAQNVVAKKYGNIANWSEATLQRMKDWGFNAIGDYAYNAVWPLSNDQGLPADSKGGHSHSVKLPFFASTRPAFYSMKNPVMHLWSGKDARLLDDPVKNILNGRSPYYNAYVPSGGIGDYYDEKMRTWLLEHISKEWTSGYIKNSPNNEYMLAVLGDDGDEMFGMACGPDFPTTPPGHNNSDLALLIISESPVQTANANFGHVYKDTQVHSKVGLRDLLTAKYGTIAALNSAWGSNYTTFGSSGTPVHGEFIGTGNGSSLSFSHKLNQLIPSKFSLQVLADGVPVAGDTGSGTIFGDDVSGTIDYGTGLLELKFSTNHAPAQGRALTVDYVKNGWAIGSGLMDEDMRPAHQAWLGNTWNGINPISGRNLKKMQGTARDDLDRYVRQTAGWYFKMLRDGIHTQFPGAMIAVEIGTWGGLPPAPVLQAAGEFVDLFEDDETRAQFDPARLDFIAKNYGDKPYLAGIYLASNADSEFRDKGNQPEGENFRTQEDRGKAYYAAVSGFLGAKNSAGTNPRAGFILWSWMDMWGEKTNWGLVSHFDNAYDGHEAVAGTVPCSPPLQKYSCGGESANYGDYLTKVKEANRLWLSIPVPAPNSIPAKPHDSKRK